MSAHHFALSCLYFRPTKGNFAICFSCKVQTPDYWPANCINALKYNTNYPDLVEVCTLIRPFSNNINCNIYYKLKLQAVMNGLLQSMWVEACCRRGLFTQHFPLRSQSFIIWWPAPTGIKQCMPKCSQRAANLY